MAVIKSNMSMGQLRQRIQNIENHLQTAGLDQHARSALEGELSEHRQALRESTGIGQLSQRATASRAGKKIFRGKPVETVRQIDRVRKSTGLMGGSAAGLVDGNRIYPGSPESHRAILFETVFSEDIEAYLDVTEDIRSNAAIDTMEMPTISGKTVILSNEPINKIRGLSPKSNARELQDLIRTGKLMSRSQAEKAAAQKGRVMVPFPASKVDEALEILHMRSKMETLKINDIIENLESGRLTEAQALTSINQNISSIGTLPALDKESIINALKGRRATISDEKKFGSIIYEQWQQIRDDDKDFRYAFNKEQKYSPAEEYFTLQPDPKAPPIKLRTFSSFKHKYDQEKHEQINKQIFDSSISGRRNIEAELDATDARAALIDKLGDRGRVRASQALSRKAEIHNRMFLQAKTPQEALDLARESEIVTIRGDIMRLFQQDSPEHSRMQQLISGTDNTKEGQRIIASEIQMLLGEKNTQLSESMMDALLNQDSPMGVPSRLETLMSPGEYPQIQPGQIVQLPGSRIPYQAIRSNGPLVVLQQRALDVTKNKVAANLKVNDGTSFLKALRENNELRALLENMTSITASDIEQRGVNSDNITAILNVGDKREIATIGRDSINDFISRYNVRDSDQDSFWTGINKLSEEVLSREAPWLKKTAGPEDYEDAVGITRMHILESLGKAKDLVGYVDPKSTAAQGDLSEKLLEILSQDLRSKKLLSEIIASKGGGLTTDAYANIVLDITEDLKSATSGDVTSGDIVKYIRDHVDRMKADGASDTQLGIFKNLRSLSTERIEEIMRTDKGSMLSLNKMINVGGEDGGRTTFLELLRDDSYSDISDLVDDISHAEVILKGQKSGKLNIQSLGIDDLEVMQRMTDKGISSIAEQIATGTVPAGESLDILNQKLTGLRELQTSITDNLIANKAFSALSEPAWGSLSESQQKALIDNIELSRIDEMTPQALSAVNQLVKDKVLKDVVLQDSQGMRYEILGDDSIRSITGETFGIHTGVPMTLTEHMRNIGQGRVKDADMLLQESIPTTGIINLPRTTSLNVYDMNMFTGRLPGSPIQNVQNLITAGETGATTTLFDLETTGLGPGAKTFAGSFNLTEIAATKGKFVDGELVGTSFRRFVRPDKNFNAVIKQAGEALIKAKQAGDIASQEMASEFLINIAKYQSGSNITSPDLLREQIANNKMTAQALMSAARKGATFLRREGINRQDAITSFLEFSKGSKFIAGHNVAAADITWMNHFSPGWLQKVGAEGVIDTLSISRALGGRAEHDVESIAKTFGIDTTGHHGGMADIGIESKITANQLKLAMLKKDELADIMRPGDKLARLSATKFAPDAMSQAGIPRGVFTIQSINQENNMTVFSLMEDRSGKLYDIAGRTQSEMLENFKDMAFMQDPSPQGTSKIYSTLAMDDLRRRYHRGSEGFTSFERMLQDFKVHAGDTSIEENMGRHRSQALAVDSQIKHLARSAAIEEKQATRLLISGADPNFRQATIDSWRNKGVSESAITNRLSALDNAPKLSLDEIDILRSKDMLLNTSRWLRDPSGRQDQMFESAKSLVLDENNNILPHIQAQRTGLAQIKSLLDVGAIDEPQHAQLVARLNNRIKEMAETMPSSAQQMSIANMATTGTLAKHYSLFDNKGTQLPGFFVPESLRTPLAINAMSPQTAYNDIWQTSQRLADAISESHKIPAESAKGIAISSIIVPELRKQGYIPESMFGINNTTGGPVLRGSLHDVANMLVGSPNLKTLSYDDSLSGIGIAATERARMAATITGEGASIVDEVLSGAPSHMRTAYEEQMSRYGGSTINPLLVQTAALTKGEAGLGYLNMSSDPRFANTSSSELLGLMRQQTLAMNKATGSFARDKVSSLPEYGTREAIIKEMKSRMNLPYGLDPKDVPLRHEALGAVNLASTDPMATILPGGKYAGLSINEALLRDPKGAMKLLRSGSQVHQHGWYGSIDVNRQMERALQTLEPSSVQPATMAFQTMQGAPTVGATTVASSQPGINIATQNLTQASQGFLSKHGTSVALGAAALATTAVILGQFTKERKLQPERQAVKDEAPDSSGEFQQNLQSVNQGMQRRAYVEEPESINGARMRIKAKETRGITNAELGQISQDALQSVGIGEININTKDDTTSLSDDYVRKRFARLIKDGYLHNF